MNSPMFSFMQFLACFEAFETLAGSSTFEKHVEIIVYSSRKASTLPLRVLEIPTHVLFSSHNGHWIEAAELAADDGSHFFPV